MTAHQYSEAENFDRPVDVYGNIYTDERLVTAEGSRTRLDSSREKRYDRDMTTININDVMQDLSDCLRKVEGGETFVILQNDKPIAELKPIAQPSTNPRPFGLCVGEFRVPDDFDAPLPDDIVRQFEGA